MSKIILNAIVVDDEESSRATLSNMLEKYCKNVKLVGVANCVDDAIKLIDKEQPQVVFLDIEMPGKNGFKLLDHYKEINFHVVFTTAYDQYAVKAFRVSAIDYLLKPIDLEHLRESVDRIITEKRESRTIERIKILQDNLKNITKKLALPTIDGFSFVKIKDIMWCEAQGNYTNFHMKNGDLIIVSKTLKIFSEILEEVNFFRSSRSHLINLNYISKFSRHRNATITLNNDKELPLTPQRKSSFLKKIQSQKA